MPSATLESTSWEIERAELQAVLNSPLFARTPALSHLLSYLCEKTFAGKTEQIKEYSIALDVFERRDSFDQDTDSIVRVQANRLRKRLSEYYKGDGKGHAIQIVIPLGQYVPVFRRAETTERDEECRAKFEAAKPRGRSWKWLGTGMLMLIALLGAMYVIRQRDHRSEQPLPSPREPVNGAAVGLPVGEEIHILAGANRKYVDHAGKIWSPDNYFSGGNAVASTVQHIWRTQDAILYRNGRQGDFGYNIPLKPGTYELRLHFAEDFYGPENSGGGGEGSRTMTVAANGKILLRDFDVLADAGGGRTAEVKVFPDMGPADDGALHLTFSSATGSAMVSAIEILPGLRGRLRPIRIVARDVPYYSDDSRWWSPDAYFKGGQLSVSQEAAQATDDPEFYETERWGHFSYAIPVAPGKYSVTLYFIEHQDGPGRLGPGPTQPERIFNVFCNGKAILNNFNIVVEVGENRPLVRKVKGLQPNAQGKLLLEFVPVKGYATVSAIEVIEE